MPTPKQRPILDKASALFSGSDRSVTTIWEATRKELNLGKREKPTVRLSCLCMDSAQVLTRYDVHEERGQFVNKQHGGMGGGGEQQEENHRGRTRHAQSRAGSKQISKPGGKKDEITI